MITFYGVYLCGPTDCFLSAAFQEEEDAYGWAAENSKNPEGFIVKEIKLDSKYE